MCLKVIRKKIRKNIFFCTLKVTEERSRVGSISQRYGSGIQIRTNTASMLDTDPVSFKCRCSKLSGSKHTRIHEGACAINCIIFVKLCTVEASIFTTDHTFDGLLLKTIKYLF
jgi:hypothetical protein